MINTTLPIGKLFEIFQKYEKLHFVPGTEQFLNSPLKIQDENNNWINVSAAITKPDTGIKVTFGNGDTVSGASQHLISTGSTCVFLKDLVVGDAITKASGEIITVADIENRDDTLFYDITVDSKTHLYQTANGIVHHNTETAVQLGRALGQPVIRYDMSEYQEQHKVAALIGSPPGYVGYGDGATGSGKLINDLEKNPNCILLLDEVEKAHPSILNVFLQLMDNGIITSSDGKSVNARNIVLIMTSNLGAAAADTNAIGFGADKVQGAQDAAVNKFFAPEFRNRLDAVIKFNKLSKEDVSRIVGAYIREINVLLKDRDIVISLDPTAVTWLIENGYNASMGARPMKRLINTEIKQPLSKKILFETGFGSVDVNISRGTDGWVYDTIAK